MSEMAFFNVGALGGNPFSTQVGQRIGKFPQEEEKTFPALPSVTSV